MNGKGNLSMHLLEHVSSASLGLVARLATPDTDAHALDRELKNKHKTKSDQTDSHGAVKHTDGIKRCSDIVRQITCMRCANVPG